MFVSGNVKEIAVSCRSSLLLTLVIGYLNHRKWCVAILNNNLLNKYAALHPLIEPALGRESDYRTYKISVLVVRTATLTALRADVMFDDICNIRKCTDTEAVNNPTKISNG